MVAVDSRLRRATLPLGCWPRPQHSVTIQNLARRTTYHFQILSQNASGHLGTSSGSFVTK